MPGPLSQGPNPSISPSPSSLSRSSSPSPSIVGDALYRLGYTQLVGKGATLASLLARGTINLASSDSASRYHWLGDMKGSLAGERSFWHHKIRDVATHSSNPLNLTRVEQAAVAARWGQSAYFDGIDPLYMCRPGARMCVFDELIVPLYRELYGEDSGGRPAPDPAPDPAPQLPVPLPVPSPPTPLPAPAPTTPTSIPQRARELQVMLTRIVRAAPPGGLRSAFLAMVQEADVLVFLERVVEIYREVKIRNREGGV